MHVEVHRRNEHSKLYTWTQYEKNKILPQNSANLFLTTDNVEPDANFRSHVHEN